MSYDLITYFNKKFAKIYPQESTHEAAPFITISRETGCGANVVGQMLLEKLRENDSQWILVNKEIVDQAAGSLKVDKNRVNEIISAEERTIANEILDALSTRYYKNDKTVLKAISEVVKHDAKSGKVIIVGRGGVAVTRGLPLGFHIKFIAPLDWRINAIASRRGVSIDQASAFVNETDRKRAKLLEQLSGKKASEILFDLTINSATFTPSQSVSLILEAMKQIQSG